MRRGLITFALGVTLVLGGASAASGAHRPAGQCSAHHVSGCDGTDSPSWDGKHGRKLMYCGPDGTCGPVDAAAAKRDTELYGDPRSR